MWLSFHSIVKLFGAKEKAMHLIEHNNPEVARYALQCVSKVRGRADWTGPGGAV